MISVTIPATVLHTGGRVVNRSIEVTLTYDVDTDPYAVQAIFQAVAEEDVVWVFSRELLNRGINSEGPVGAGDVKFRYLGVIDGGLLMCLSNPDSHCDVRFDRDEVDDFLLDTLRVCPVGGEQIGTEVDDLIEEILNG